VVKNSTEAAFEKVNLARNISEDVMNKSGEFTVKLQRYLATPGAKPAEIRILAEEVSFSRHNNIYINIFEIQCLQS